MPNLLKFGFIRRFWQKFRKVKRALGMKDAPANPYPYFVEVTLYEPVDPDIRSSRYAEPLEKILNSKKFGTVSGGGTSVAPRDAGGGDISYTVLDLNLANLNDALHLAKSTLTELGVSVGTTLEYFLGGERHQEEFGEAELVRLYIKRGDSEETHGELVDLHSQLTRLAKDGNGEIREPAYFWETETLYWFTGTDADILVERICSLLADFPILKDARIVTRKRTTFRTPEEITM